MAAIHDLAKTIAAAYGMPYTVLWGVVQSADGGPLGQLTLTITLAGSSEPVSGVGYNSSYVPSLLDTVLILNMGGDGLTGGDLFVLGKRA
jgi:hypothetical protein